MAERLFRQGQYGSKFRAPLEPVERPSQRSFAERGGLTGAVGRYFEGATPYEFLVTGAPQLAVVPKVVGETIKLGREGREFKEDVTQGFREGVWQNLFGAPEVSEEVVEGIEQAGVPAVNRNEMLEGMEQQLAAYDREVALVEEMRKNPQLTPEQERMLDEQEQIVGRELADLNREMDGILNELNLAMQIDALRADPEADLARLELYSRADVNRLLNEERGVDEEFAEEVLDLIAGGEDIGPRVRQESFKQDMLDSLHDVVSNKRASEESITSLEADLLAEQRNQQYPVFGLNVDSTPTGMYLDAFGQAVDTIDISVLSPTQLESFGGWIDTLGAMGDEEYEAQAPQIYELIDVQTPLAAQDVRNLVEQGRNNGKRAAEAAANPFEEKRYGRGSVELIAAIYQSLVSRGVSPEEAQTWSNSHLLHNLIDMRSGGNPNWSNNGSQSGLGGLTARTYRALDYDPENMSVDQQLYALYAYIRNNPAFDFSLEGAYRAAADGGEASLAWGDI